MSPPSTTKIANNTTNSNIEREVPKFDPAFLIAIAQLFGTSLWYSANSAADDLGAWGIGPSDILAEQSAEDTANRPNRDDDERQPPMYSHAPAVHLAPC